MCLAQLAGWRRRAAQGCFLCQHKAQPRDCRSCSYPGLICPVRPPCPSKQDAVQQAWLGYKATRGRGEQSPAPPLGCHRTREVQARAGSTLLVLSEAVVGAMRWCHPAEAPLTVSECTSKTQMSQRHQCSSDYSHACPKEQLDKLPLGQISILNR